MRCFLIESDNNKVNPTKLSFLVCIIDVTPSSGPSIHRFTFPGEWSWRGIIMSRPHRLLEHFEDATRAQLPQMSRLKIVSSHSFIVLFNLLLLTLLLFPHSYSTLIHGYKCYVKAVAVNYIERIKFCLCCCCLLQEKVGLQLDLSTYLVNIDENSSSQGNHKNDCSQLTSVQVGNIISYRVPCPSPGWYCYSSRGHNLRANSRVM